MAKQSKSPIIDRYLREVAPNSMNITESIKLTAEVLGVAPSTVSRWRAADCVPGGHDIIAILSEVNKSRKPDQKCTLKDVAILCNYKDIQKRLIAPEGKKNE